MENLIRNWKTTSTGLTLIIGSTVHLIFMIRSGAADENTWTTALLADVMGFGLIFAGDASASAQSHLKSQTQIAELQLLSNVVPDAIENHDTTLLRKVPITPAIVPPPVILTDTQPPSSGPAPTTKVN